jgi:diadenosine tetraphosphatase ApaH/serine/threonine PP2A family protein phosphatase
VRAQATFGNYEVTRWRQLSAVNQEWVRALEPAICGEGYVAAHAAPFLPTGLNSVDQVLDYVLERGVEWHSLFPRLERDENARRRTYTALVRRGKQVFFHGHSHLQAAWRIGEAGSMSRISEACFRMEPGEHYIVGVGSVGQPEDGRKSRYVIYDQAERTVALCTVAR